MSAGRKPYLDLTIPLIVLYLIVHFGVIVPGIRAIRANFFEAKHPRYDPLTSE